MESVVQQVKKDVKSDYTRLRWAVGLSGALSVAVGVIILIWPSISLFALTMLWGAYMVVSGGFAFAAAADSRMKKYRGRLVFASALSIIAGLLVLIWPSIGELALLYVIGAYAITLGVVMAGGAFWLPIDGADKALLVFSGAVSILFGIVMFAKPGAGALVVLALIAAFALVTGVSELVLAIGGKRLVEADVKRAIKQADTELRRNEPQPTA
jgi:uncharacterized membrane protein HdeD (DUF308 family)